MKVIDADKLLEQLGTIDLYMMKFGAELVAREDVADLITAQPDLIDDTAGGLALFRSALDSSYSSHNTQGEP